MTVVEARARGGRPDHRTAGAGARGCDGRGRARRLLAWLRTPRRTRGGGDSAPPVGRDACRPTGRCASSRCCSRGQVLRGARELPGRGGAPRAVPEEGLLAEWERNILDATRQAREVCGMGGARVGIGYRVRRHYLHALCGALRPGAREPVSGAVFVKQWRGCAGPISSRHPRGEGVDLMGLWLTDEQARQLSTLTDPRRLPELPGNVEILDC
ncbi:hypothetical protein QJS66_07915 [Kocuria rhizophila]|nr:hypothetical protein QJS66_07915 [Kocuria rhizophila]